MTKSMYAHVIPCKGVDEDRHVVKLLVADIQLMGHVRMLLKSDNAPSIRRLLEECLMEIKVKVEDLEQVSKEFPGKYES